MLHAGKRNTDRPTELASLQRRHAVTPRYSILQLPLRTPHFLLRQRDAALRMQSSDV